jgi:hypothetical protein
MQPNAGSVNKTKAGVKSIEQALRDVEKQANATREKMAKLADVGRRLAMVGGLILAPMALAFKKYLELAKADDPVAKRIKAIGTQLTDIQVRFGKLVAENVLPLLEKALPYIDKAITFAEKNPGLVKAALTIGASLVVLGGIVSTTASIISTIATIQGLAAGFGATLAGGGAAAGFSAALAPVLTALAPIALIVADVALVAATVVAAAELTRQLVNWALGTNTTWGDILVTVKQLGFLIKYGFTQTVEWLKKLPYNIGYAVGKYLSNLGTSIYNGIKSFGASISAGLASLANAIRSFLGLPKKAAGGMTNGVSIAGERGREFVMSNSTTKAAESMLGGQLTQQRLLQALSGSKSITYHDNRRIDSALSKNDRRVIANDITNALAGAL